MNTAIGALCGNITPLKVGGCARPMSHYGNLGRASPVGRAIIISKLTASGDGRVRQIKSNGREPPLGRPAAVCALAPLALAAYRRRVNLQMDISSVRVTRSPAAGSGSLECISLLDMALTYSNLSFSFKLCIGLVSNPKLKHVVKMDLNIEDKQAIMPETTSYLVIMNVPGGDRRASPKLQETPQREHNAEIKKNTPILNGVPLFFSALCLCIGTGLK
ncbi:hypothetical protein EVAR_81571_1 [Eumeta japonica]|uniref:Uncharacterized protein n=1 Tax=Eumeta variegata TaxID=151549 RepID=A0A4C1UZB9_EUMVA|nr:hypothetical protein EVAR_81571_1 [Eumeta japonica]